MDSTNCSCDWLTGLLRKDSASFCPKGFQALKVIYTVCNIWWLEVIECCIHTDKHGSSSSNLSPVALEELDDRDVVEVQHARKVLNLQNTKHAQNMKTMQTHLLSSSTFVFNIVNLVLFGLTRYLVRSLMNSP